MLMVVMLMVVCAFWVRASVFAARVFPTYPIGARGPMFSLPDGHFGLDAIDEQATSPEGLIPMRSGSPADHREIAHLKPADPVKRSQTHARDLGGDPEGNSAHLLLGHTDVGVVLKQRHLAGFVLVSDGSQKKRDASSAWMFDRAQKVFGR